MLGTAILGFLAGTAAPYAEPRVKRAMEAVLQAEPPVTPLELRSFSLALCLAGAAAAALLFGGGNPLALAMGALPGVFGPRIAALVLPREGDGE